MGRTLGLLLFAALLRGQGTYTISTLTGGASTPNGFTGDGELATRARLNRPSGLALDQNGDLYISDTWNQAVRVVDAAGKIRTIAGTGAEGFAGDGGPATQAKLLFPRGIALDSRGNLYIAEGQGHRIRRVKPDGIISTFAGTGERGYSGDGGPALSAKLDRPDGIAIDADDILYFTDSGNNLVRRISPDGVISKVAGEAPARGARPNHAGSLDSPRGIAFDRAGILYVADRQHARICRIDRAGVISVVAGDGIDKGLSPTEAPGDGSAAIDASIPYPSAVAFDPDGKLLIAAGKIRRVDRDGIITTILGARLDRPVADNGDPLQTRLSSPEDVVVDAKGNIYVADTYRHRVLRLSANGALDVIAGLSDFPEEKEGGPAETLHLWGPWSVSMGLSGDVFVADSEMNRIVRIGRGGNFRSVAGKGIPILRMEGQGPPPQFSGDNGPATAADLDYPFGVAVDSRGSLYISDLNNQRVRKVTVDGVIRTIAGTGEAGSSGDNGPAVQARLSNPAGLAVDSHGNVYVADCGNNSVRQISSRGIIRTVVRGLKCPHGVAFDGKDTLFIADTFNHLIKRLDPDGKVRTIAGTGKQEFKGDGGPAVEAGLGAPDSLAIDSQGNIYIADRANWVVRKITPDGIIHTIAGNHETGYSGDGGPALRAPIFPTSVAVDAAGAVYVTDHNRIRVLIPKDP